MRFKPQYRVDNSALKRQLCQDLTSQHPDDNAPDYATSHNVPLETVATSLHLEIVEQHFYEKQR